MSTEDFAERLALLDEYPGYGFHPDGLVFTRKIRGSWGRLADEWRPLAIKVNPQTGYGVVNLTNRDRRPVTNHVHALICTAFHGPRPDGFQVCHNDGNRLNNAASNLRWDSPANNMADAFRHGTFVVGSRHHSAKLAESDIPLVFELHLQGWTQQRIADRFGVDRSNISLILGHRIWKQEPKGVA